MARPRRTTASRSTGDYRHDAARRKNNPPVGMASYEAKTAEQPRTHYGYDPHLSPQLIWAGKPGLRSIEVEDAAGLEVDTVSLHIHERVSTQAIINAVQRPQALQLDLFADPRQPLREAVEFYRHDVDWANRLLLGDSLLVMNSLLQRELLAGQVQMIYIDPPYGVKFSSNFQPRIDQRGVREGDDDLTREPEQIKAYRDTWTLGIHSYLTYLRDRLRVARELLADSGSIFVQISDENLHFVRCLMDEVFGAENLCGQITFVKTTGLGTALLASRTDYLLWYAKDQARVKYRQLFGWKRAGEMGASQYDWIREPNGRNRKLRADEIPTGQERVFHTGDVSAMFTTPHLALPIDFEGKEVGAPPNRQWQTTQEGMSRLREADRLMLLGKSLRYVRYLEDFPVLPFDTLWTDTGVSGFADPKVYVVQTNTKVIERCMLMTTDPGDLVLDPTCGSGTTAYVAEQWGRRWITCDTSRVAVSLARQRLLTATYPYYTLAQAERGVDAGFRYKTVPHITLRSIAQNTRIDPVVARYQPLLDEALAELNRSTGEAWQPWEVPGGAKAGWAKETRDIHQRYLDLRRRKQGEIDRIIAEDAPQETLYDQPQIDNKIVRVAGPFTVEAIPPAVEQFMQEETRIGGAPLPLSAEFASPDANEPSADAGGFASG
ncbi:MAG: site-specific DNA-methyltransferase, partial [Anaerolineae bacterium]